jgi:hypothetical protein
MLTRLIYASEPTEALTPDTMQHIVDRARVNNKARHLSGMLAFDSHHFLQVLEGPRDALSALYGRIVGDPRHRCIELLEVAPVHERRFARWSMGFAAADAVHGEIFFRFGGNARFDPKLMSAASALGLLEAMDPASTATSVSTAACA